VTFDTSTGPTTLAYVGQGTGSQDDSTVKDGSSVHVKPGNTSNGLLTVIDSECDFRVKSDSSFGQDYYDFNDYDTGYSQIVIGTSNGFSDSVEVTGDSTVFGRLHAKDHQLKLEDGAFWFGSALVKSVSIRGDGDDDDESRFAVDEGTTGNVLTDPTNVQFLARWRANP